VKYNNKFQYTFHIFKQIRIPKLILLYDSVKDAVSCNNVPLEVRRITNQHSTHLDQKMNRNSTRL